MHGIFFTTSSEKDNADYTLPRIWSPRRRTRRSRDAAYSSKTARDITDSEALEISSRPKVHGGRSEASTCCVSPRYDNEGFASGSSRLNPRSNQKQRQHTSTSGTASDVLPGNVPLKGPRYGLTSATLSSHCSQQRS